jgi:hypothetical protein
MSPSTIVRPLRMSSWCLGQRLFWVLQEVGGHCIYGHETGNRSCGCIVWRASWRLTTCALSSLCQENPSPRPIFGQRVLGQIRRTTNHEKQATGFAHLLAIWSCSWGQTMASAPPRPPAQSVDKNDMSRTNYNGGITTTLATKLRTYLFQLSIQQTP